MRTAIKELVRAEQPQALAQSPAAEQSPVAVQGQGQNQLPVRIIPFGRKSGSGIKSLAPLGAHLTYWGGPVISNVQVVAVFWGPNVVSAVTANGAIDQFYTDITTSRYFDELTEYTTAGITGADGISTSNQAIGHGTFAGKFTITPSICPGPAACTVNDTQIQSELTTQINSHALPAPQTDAHGIINTYYAIYFPPNVTISIANINSCVSGGFCAYHSNTGSLVPYGVLPDVSTGGCSLGCGSGSTFQIATGVSSHEMAEAITDPQVGSASVFGPPLGWYDNPPNLGEIADLCNPFTVTVNAGATTYTVEMLFSNVQNDCAAGPPNFSMPSPAGGAGPSVPFNMTLTIRANEPAVITPLNYLGTVHFTSSDPGAVLPADYTFTAADAGVHTFPFTLTVLGDQTITVSDTRSSGFTGTATVNVNTVPDMTIALHHTGNFGQGQVGATYTIAVANLGGGPSSGTVTVVDTLPNGMTATAMSGTGWTCNVNTATCTRADVLAAGGSYPPITLTVNVSTVISSSVNNTATVSGGGETITSDNLAADATTIVSPGLDLASAINPSQIFTTQGATGVTFTATVNNFGNVQTNGTVTLTATLGQGITATAISGTGWSCTLANLTCTRNDVLASALSYPGVTITFDVPLNAPLVTSSVSVTVSGGGTDTSTGNNTATTTVSIGAALAIFSNTPSVTEAAGTPARFQVGVNATAAAGNVTFSCSGLPALSSCSFSPASLSNSSTQVTMTVTTTARGAAVPAPGPANRNPRLWLEMLLLAAMGGWALRLAATPERRRRLVPIFGACILLVAGLLAGCGSGSTTTTVVNTTQGTPAGTYVITFTATSTNAGTTSRTMTLIVQ